MHETFKHEILSLINFLEHENEHSFYDIVNVDLE